MSLLLYLSSSVGLTNEDKLLIDTSVSENRKSIYILIKRIPYTRKSKTKKIGMVFSVVMVVYFTALEPVSTIGLPISPAPVVRLQPSFDYSFIRPNDLIYNELITTTTTQ